MQTIFEKIIEKLEEEKMSYFLTIANTGDEKLDYAYEQVGDALDKAIEIVKQEAYKFGTDINVGSNGWIPCSSGVMPRANGWYLVTNHLGVVQEQRWSANHWEKLRDEAVLAWRELPLPYQPNGE